MSESSYETNPSKFKLVFAGDGINLETITETITATFAFVVNDQDEILALKNERGWDIPGGHLDSGEKVIDATHREVLEESCVTIKNMQPFAFIKNGETAMSVFTARPEQVHKFEPHQEDPTSDRSWLKVEDFRQVYSGGDKPLMNKLLDHLMTHSPDNIAIRE